MLLDGHVRGHVATEGESGGVSLLTPLFRARIGSFHLVLSFEACIFVNVNTGLIKLYRLLGSRTHLACPPYIYQPYDNLGFNYLIVAK